MAGEGGGGAAGLVAALSSVFGLLSVEAPPSPVFLRATLERSRPNGPGVDDGACACAGGGGFFTGSCAAWGAFFTPPIGGGGGGGGGGAPPALKT